MPAKKVITKDKAQQVLGALRIGADMGMAARAIGVSRRGLYKHIEQDDDFREACEEARNYADETIVHTLYQQAKGGNTTAIIFWLKNRKRKEWRDRHDLEHTGADGSDLIFRAYWADGQPAPTGTAFVPTSGPDIDSTG